MNKIGGLFYLNKWAIVDKSAWRITSPARMVDLESLIRRNVFYFNVVSNLKEIM